MNLQRKLTYIFSSFMLMTTIGCKKVELVDEISRKETKEFSQTLKIPDLTRNNEYLNLKITANDREYLKTLVKYYSELNINFIEAKDFDIIPDIEIDKTVFSDSLSYSTELDWSNYSFKNTENDEKSLKILTFSKANTQKAFQVFGGLQNSSGLTSSTPFAWAFVLANTQRYYFFGWHNYNSNWKFYKNQNGTGEIYEKSLGIAYNQSIMTQIGAISCKNLLTEYVLINNSSNNLTFDCPSSYPMNPNTVYTVKEASGISSNSISNKMRKISGTGVHAGNSYHQAKGTIHIGYYY